MSRQTTSRYAGNVIFMILIFCVLFAALSYAVTQSMRGTTAGVDNEKLTLQVNEYLSFMNIYATRMRELKTLNSCNDNQITFKNSLNGGGGYINSNTPSDYSCSVMKFGSSPTDGILNSLMPLEWFDQSYSATTDFRKLYFDAAHCIWGVGSGSSACVADNADFLAFAPYVSKAFCEALNKKMEVNSPTYAAPTMGMTMVGFTGNFLTAGSPNISTAALIGKPVGCYKSSSGSFSGGYIAYYTILPR